ncbi:MAG: RidA family protein [Oscillospiraceae bacterium]|nr:RidA family protein [Oscillospiraceae bacterium]MBR4346816.1 RidA family protein [Oscillospiraceae bacterium]
MSEKIYTKTAPDAIGPYSQAIRAGGFLFTSGQIPIDPASGTVTAQGIEEQTHQICKNLGEVLKAAGMGFENVVKTTCFLDSMDDFAAFNEVYAQYFTSKPARSCVEVAKLPKGVLAEVELIAAE